MPNWNYYIGLIGTWILSDAIYSLMLYLKTDQTWARDHWVRIVRGLCGIALIIMGLKA